MTKIKSILRWLLCLPAGSLAGGLAFILYTGIGFERVGWFGLALGGALSGAAMLYVTCWVAPSRERVVAVITVILLLIVNVISIILSFQLEDWSFCLLYLSQCVGAVVVARSIRSGDIAFR
jgi:hypothetical protein